MENTIVPDLSNYVPDVPVITGYVKNVSNLLKYYFEENGKPKELEVLAKIPNMTLTEVNEGKLHEAYEVICEYHETLAQKVRLTSIFDRDLTRQIQDLSNALRYVYNAGINAPTLYLWFELHVQIDKTLDASYKDGITVFEPSIESLLDDDSSIVQMISEAIETPLVSAS